MEITGPGAPNQKNGGKRGVLQTPIFPTGYSGGFLPGFGSPQTAPRFGWMLPGPLPFRGDGRALPRGAFGVLRKKSLRSNFGPLFGYGPEDLTYMAEDDRKETLQSQMIWAAGRYSGYGLTWALSTLLFLLGGWWLDGKVGTTPLFMILGAFVGAGAGFYSLYRHIVVEPQDRDEDVEP